MPSSKPTPASSYHAWQRAILRDDFLRKASKRSSNSHDLRLTAITLASFGTSGMGCRPKVATLADILGYGERTVRRHLEELVYRGWFTCTRKPRQPSVYDVTMPRQAGQHDDRLSRSA